MSDLHIIRKRRGGRQKKKKLPDMDAFTESSGGEKSFQKQALEIIAPGENFDPAAEPQTGEEFLMKMVYERKRIPAVVVKPPKELRQQECQSMQQTVAEDEGATSSKYFEKDALVDSAPKVLRPTPKWKEDIIYIFLETRKEVASKRLNAFSNNDSEALDYPSPNDSFQWLRFCRKNQPLLHIALSIRQRALENLLELICYWLSKCEAGDINLEAELPSGSNETKSGCCADGELEEKEESLDYDVPCAATSDPNESVDLSKSHSWLGTWLYTTLTCLDLPLEPGVHSTLRDIARTCIRLRNKCTEQEIEKAAPLNLFVCLIAFVFNQLDFEQYI